MHLTNGKWVVSLLWNLDFINDKVEKQHSFSQLPIIYTITSSTIFTYIGNC
jgi:hypothetical protein